MASKKDNKKPATPGLTDMGEYYERMAVAREQTTKVLAETVAEAPVKDLTERERRFSEAYVAITLEMGKDFGCGHLAYRRAFPLSEATTHGAYTMAQAMLKMPRVQEYIGVLRHEFTKRTMMPYQRVVQEMERLATSNIFDYVRVQPSGEARIDLSEVTYEQAACIQELIFEDNEKTGKRIRIKLYDKQRSQDMLNRVHGAYNDKMSLALTVETLDRVILDMREKLIAQGVDPEAVNALFIEGTAVDITEKQESLDEQPQTDGDDT